MIAKTKMSTRYPFSDDLLIVWEEYRSVAKRSREFKRIVNRSRIFGLLLLVIGAVFGVLADQSTGWAASRDWLPTAFALTSAISLAMAAFVSRFILDSHYEKNWVYARSRAEALKSEAYVYLVGAPPYDGVDRDEQLSMKAQEIIEKKVYPKLLAEEEKYEKLPII
jgi:uncharacterized membrane protein (DUF485 family)